LIKRGLAQSGQTTQFVVGPAGETDYDLVKMSNWMYERMELRRSYFSAFQPVQDTPFSQKSGTPLLREHRLYQMDWLLRVYEFNFKELECVFNEDGNLPLSMDPKYVYANENNVSVDPNEATKQELLTVPGIGPISANRIITIRKFGPLNQKKLKRAGVVVKRALPFLKISGQQLRLSDFKQDKIPVSAEVIR
jgi:predicted DNA-binding helix-hairpin-helix protein